MIRTRRARIVATLGPASRRREMVLALAAAGRGRVPPELQPRRATTTMRATIEAVREAEAALERPLGVLADLQGPKLRLGDFAEGEVDPGGRRRPSASTSTRPGRRQRASACRIPRSSPPCKPGDD